jgi:hypothetical protein
VSGGTKTHQITIELQSTTTFTRNSRKTKREKLTQREQKRKNGGKEKRMNFLYQTENAKERKELSLHSWVEQARQKHQKIEVFVRVFCAYVWVGVVLCTRSFLFVSHTEADLH